MIFELDVSHKPAVTNMQEGTIYLQKLQIFPGSAPYEGRQHLVVCAVKKPNYCLVQDLDSQEITAVNTAEGFNDLERYVFVDAGMAEGLEAILGLEKHKRLVAYQRAEHMMDELGAI